MSKRLIETPIDGEIVHEGLFFDVRRDRARMPDGGVAQREFVLHPGAAAIVPLFEDGRVLVERQFRYPLKQVFVEIPAGKRDRGEQPLATAKRELLEETGYRAALWAPLTSIHPAIGMADERIDIFLARELEPVSQTLDEGEFVELEVVTLGWLVDELVAGRLTDVKTQIAVHWLERIESGRWPWPAFTREL
ncbi:MAG: NUDIX hydrolase [Burkholderiaceae bacterium]